MNNDSLSRNIDLWSGRLPIGEVAPEVNLYLDRCKRLVITAPPGSGKSTLLPLVILQGVKQGKVLMLEPRRLAARQIAMRMADMLGEKVGQMVGYRVRFESAVSVATRIEVITEGILERMLIDDPTLSGYDAVIFDEFHERSLASDTALALSLEAQKLVRPDLRLVIMSATVDAVELCNRFDAPHLHGDGRMHDVEIIHLDDFDPRDCPAAVARGIRRALREQPGDILAFLPGQAEIRQCMEMLQDAGENVMVLPLYGLLPPEEQHRTLSPAPAGMRKVVLATSIAETSLTIEGVRAVVDSGLCRTMVFDPNSSLSRLVTTKVSLDMAAQRTGRAGRLTNGVCYRLWSKPSQSRMKEAREPEILTADLAPLTLTVAAWGESNPAALPWITPPPGALVQRGQKLLKSLGAIDDTGSITPAGKRMSGLPCHPRIAAMLLESDDKHTKALAADIAALIEEKDIAADENDADICNRIALLRQARRSEHLGRLRRVNDVARQYCRMVGAREDCGAFTPEEAGKLIAVAYRERIAMRCDDGRYRLSGGDFVTLGERDDLEANEFLAVASVGSRIFLAAPMGREDAERMGKWHNVADWDSRQGRIVAQRELRIGALILTVQASGRLAPEKAAEILCRAARKDGRTMFDFNDRYQSMHLRISALAGWHPEMNFPDTSVESLLDNAVEWLPMYAGDAITVAELRKIDMSAVVWGLLSYEQQQAAERLAPTHFRLPSGKNVKIDYRTGAEAPIISARLQDCFGLTETPRVDGGKRPVLMELLSPGFKPVQLTSDLGSFWHNTYFEVRKELRRRYPKHRWPEDPLESF